MNAFDPTFFTKSLTLLISPCELILLKLTGSAPGRIIYCKLSRKRILIENIIRRLKIFHILSERYRNRRKRFGLRFNLIAAIYNMELKTTL